jgi:serine/threonine-protein kinase
MEERAMSLKLTASSFLACVKKSSLMESQRVDALMQEFQQQGIDCNDATAIAATLVDRKELTEWQAEKLLQGRHLGFILGRYKVLSLLGQGEMSSVYLAEHVLMERKCAIKVLPANKVQDTSYLERFRREALAVASMNHPNIVRAYDVDKKSESGTEIHFLVMEFVEGRDLEQKVKEHGPLEIASAVDYIRQAADGLAHAHQMQMVHRDVKPGNLLVDAMGCVKVLDLGLARFFKTNHEESLTIKHDEKVLGTADYLAPEQAVDSHRVDARADIYSLGCTLYFALTGHPPFTDGTLVQRLLAHQTKRPPCVRTERPEVDDELLAILEKMMAKKCADRYQTATEVSEALSRWLIKNASSAWKRRHLSLVAMLGSPEDVPVDQPRTTVCTVSESVSTNGPRANVPATSPASTVAVAAAPSRPVSDSRSTGSQRPAGSKTNQRRSGSSLRLTSSSSETLISREASPLRRKAVRTTTSAPRTASQAAAPKPAPAAATASRTLGNADRSSPWRLLPTCLHPNSLKQKLHVKPGVWGVIAVVATILLCASYAWYVNYGTEAAAPSAIAVPQINGLKT